MWAVAIWVPTKGWKTVGKYRTEAKAQAMVDVYTPLETRITTPDNCKYYAGVVMEPKWAK